MDEFRARYLRDRVMTASPAQRVVMLYDRLSVDLQLARAGADDPAALSGHVSHAVKIVAELYGSLDVSAGGPAENLASIYTFLLNELMGVQRSGEAGALAAVERIVGDLRQAWAAAAGQLADTASPVAAGALKTG